MGESESSSELGGFLKGLEVSSPIDVHAVLQDAEKQNQSSLVKLKEELQESLNMIPAELPRSLSMEKLKEVVYEAEELIDELTFEIHRRKITTTHFNPFFRAFHFLKNAIFNAKLARKAKNLKGPLREIDIILSRKMRVSGIDLYMKRNSVPDIPVIGREVDASKIVNLLSSGQQQQVLTVFPIVGMDGLGKTALAKFVCRRVMSMNLFDVKMWVCVSDKFDELQVLGQILRSLDATMAGLISLTDKDAIFEQLEKELGGKSFILVLDDVCEDVCRWWGDFRTRLLKICTNNGNAVLVTTHSEEVASFVETSSQHRHTLDFLSDDDCWFIFKERAFRNVTEPVESYLEATGREIAEISRGLPLAANILGGTLGLYGNAGMSLLIRGSHIWENEENVGSILKLSFDNLSSPLKKCLAICSVFPKGFLLNKEDLIQLWMAEKFVVSCDMANRNFHVLLENSFFQDIEFDHDGNVIKCKMHSLVHDLALSLVKSETRIQYLYADYQSVRSSKAPPKNRVNYLHTIILNGAHFQSSWNLKRLQTLYLNDVDMESLPSSISKLKHFKYLHISNTKTRPLPKSITSIYMLQILTLSNCSCEQFPLLGHLPYLKFLKISRMEKVKFIGEESYEGNSTRQDLRLFPALKSLSLSWMGNLIGWSPVSPGNGVVIFPLLEYLSIQCCPKLTGFPLRELSALVKVEIKDCEELRFVFDEHKSFPSVTSLSVVGCPKLTYLRNWLLSNKSYKEFRVRRCEWLNFIPEDLGMQSSLTSLQIYCCKGLRLFSEEILGELTKLRRLSIGAFSENLDDFRYLNGIKDLGRLTELEIWGSDVFGRQMSVLPNQLQHLYGLKSLKIKGFTTMEALPEWLVSLCSLQTISLNYCWHLEHQSTAAIIQRLSNLSHVYIYGCCALEELKSQWMDFSDGFLHLTATANHLALFSFSSKAWVEELY